jgi:hypothetical protein
MQMEIWQRITLFMINGGAVSWSAKKQKLVTLSTTELEYASTVHASKEALWLCSLISQIFTTKLDTTTLFSDNQSATALTSDHQYHPCTKHINIQYHFIQWIIEDGQIWLIYCLTDNMVADIFTKALPLPKVKHFTTLLRLISA